MIGQFAKRPESRHKSNLRPVTGRATEESIKQSNQCFEIAKKHMMKKQYDQALKHYTNATIHNPGNFKALCNMGRIYKQTNKFNEARFCYHKALFANSNDPITLYNLANLERICGNDEIAIQLYKKVISLKQNQNVDVGSLYFDSYINQGICYKNLQFYDEAVACNDKAIQISPNDQSCHFNKAMCILKKIYTLLRTNFVSVKRQLCKQDETNFKKVLQINPNNFTAKVALIQLSYLDDPSEPKLKKAVQQLQKLQKIAAESQKYELDLKIKYCKNQLKKIDEAKIILQPKQDIVERVETANKYDQANKKQDQQKNNKPQNQKTQDKAKPNIKQQKKPQVVPVKPKQQMKPISAGQSSLSNQKRKKIASFLSEKKYSQAFEVAKDLPDSNEKYELEIIINYYQCVDEENQIYLESAIGIYNQYIIKNDENTPITRDTCSEEGHEVMATMLTVYGNYAQASKHYEILLNLVQDKKFQKSEQKENDEKLREIHVELGVCYAERGLIQQAISEYKKSLQMQPENYFLMTNLCGLLIQDNKKEEARKYYEQHLVKNGGQEMEDKASYVDSLLNISICVRETAEQEAALEKTIEAVEKFFPTMESIKTNLNEEAILGLYLRQVQILEQKSEKSKPGSLERKQIGQKMLQANLTCLNFDYCPDREAICVNTGILFYLSGCYANALSFYRAVVFSKKIIANNIALTLLQMSQYERGSSWLQLAIQENPDNIIYATNLQIVKWICGIEDRKQTTKYQCKCETMYETRAQLGLHLINQLTTMIDQNQVKITTADGAASTREEAEKLFVAVLDRCSHSEKLANRNQIWKIKSKVIYQKLDQHMKQVHMKQPVSSKISVPTNILDLALKKAPSSKQLQENLNRIMDYINGLNSTSPQFDIIQNLIYLQIISNSELPNISFEVSKIINKRQIKNISKIPESLQTAQFKLSSRNYFEKRLLLQIPGEQPKFKTLQSMVREVESNVQNQIQYLIETIENFYYIKPENILSALYKEYNFPHCQNSVPCIRCSLNSTHLYNNIFSDLPMYGDKVKISKKWTMTQQIESFEKALENYVNKALESQANGIYSKKNNEIHIKFDYKKYPITLRTHHKNFNDIVQFLKRIDKQFTIAAETGNADRGIRVVEINKCVILELMWGNVTTLDKFCLWLTKRQTHYVHDAIFMLEDINQVSQVFENRAESAEKIKASIEKDD